MATGDDGGVMSVQGGPAPEIGRALRARSEEISERLVSLWQGGSETRDRAATVAADIRRSTRAGTLAVADYLVTGEVVTRDRSEEWDWTGEAPLAGRIALASVTKLYVHWRGVCEEVVREEVKAHGADQEVLDRCLQVLQRGFGASLVRMARRFEVTRRDLEEQLEEHRARLEHQALHDPLTGLANRVLLLDRLEHALESAARRPTGAAVLFMDLDYFKAVNDASGHSAGDQLLLGVARRLQAAVRPNDTIARLGGDEFVVLCEDLGDPVEESVAVAQRIAERFEDPFMVGDREIVVAASIGVAPAGRDDTADALLGRADHAMYRAKELGRGRVELYDPSIDHQQVRRAELSAALHHAVPDGQLRLVYQPLVKVRTRRVLAREALVRWEHPVFGFVGPDDIIPLAESTGLITSIGRWVLVRACMDCAAWREEGDPGVGVTVNVSGLQLASGKFHTEVESALKKSGLPPDALTVEVTETLLMSDRADVRDGLDRVRALGVRIAIDDFGTGYSSLSWLASLPVDVVKIDRSFVALLGLVDRQAAVVDAVIHLAHSLGLDVVAEGVESDAQLRHLTRLGCDEAQGFLLGYPAGLTRSD
ncbi:MAG TPA: EAL domain-containing protein [Acidimicrobiales bacterium]|nr:EAL domain-containing protein [Acidimicrobiales bacterium]